MDPMFKTILEEWRQLDDLMREAEAARPRWAMLHNILNNLVNAYPDDHTVEVVREIRAAFGPMPRAAILEAQLQATTQDAVAVFTGQVGGGVTAVVGQPSPRIQMWPLAYKVLAEKGPMPLKTLHDELIGLGWRSRMDPRDRRVLYNTLMAMNNRFAKVDDKWTVVETKGDE